MMELGRKPLSIVSGQLCTSIEKTPQEFVYLGHCAISLNHFLAAVWCQFLFLRIHPFADGHGRVARIISLAPLISAGFPPVLVSAAWKSAYFDALNVVVSGVVKRTNPLVWRNSYIIPFAFVGERHG
ncbi:hypothetical protein DFJ77DRAFT_458152 [Powellomyces hirtus]|nr:hypothetical protein DFJ77DRAFT_458152 [Powellomyces hirtus]